MLSTYALILTLVNRAWWVSNRERPRVEIPSDALSTYQPQNDTNPDATALEAFLAHPSIRTISADIVAGQIIATIIVVAFVAIFLLREWITQNARPGVFDEADAPPAGAIPVVAEPVVLPVPAQIPVPPPQQDLLRCEITPCASLSHLAGSRWLEHTGRGRLGLLTGRALGLPLDSSRVVDQPCRHMAPASIMPHPGILSTRRERHTLQP